MKPRAILMDMDGVTTNFILGAHQLFDVKVPYEDVMRNWPKGTFDVTKVFEIETSEFWRRIEEAGSAYWEGLLMYPGAQTFYRDICDLGVPVIFASSPGLMPSACAGKVNWLRAFHGGDIPYGSYMLGSRKSLMAHPDVILIDDYDKNVKAFTQAGGHAVRVPRPWNSDHPLWRSGSQATASGDAWSTNWDYIYAEVLDRINRIRQYD